MKKALLSGLFLLAALAMQATEVTIRPADGYRIDFMYIDGEARWMENDEMAFSYTTDLEPGTHSLWIALMGAESYESYGLGAEQVLNVGDTPMTITYDFDANYAPVNFTVTDDEGQPCQLLLDLKSTSSTKKEFYQSTGYTDENGQCRLYLARGMEYTYTVSGSGFAPKTGTVTAGTDTDVAISYADYYRLSVTAAGFELYDPGYDYSCDIYIHDVNGKVISSSNVTASEPTASALVPDGTYYCQLSMPRDDNGTTAYAPFVVNVAGSAVSLSADFAQAQLVEATKDGEPYTFTVNLAEDVNGNMTFNFDRAYLMPGTYIAQAYTSDEQDNNFSFKQAFTVADAPVTIEIPTTADAYHHVTFDVANDYGEMLTQGTVGGIPICNMPVLTTDCAFSDGEYSWTLLSVWYGDYSYGLPFMPTGTVTIAGADATVPVDLRGYKLFTTAFERTDGQDLDSGGYITNAAGESVWVGTLSIRGLGLCLQPGSYTVSFEPGYGTGNTPLAGTLTVPEDCPSSLTVQLSETAGIEGVTAESKAGLSVVNGGLKVTTDGGSATVEVYDTTGRRVLTAQARDGETVSTASLPQGVYIARSSQGSTVKSLKFINK